MAGQMMIPIVRDTDYAYGDLVEIEIEGEVQPDRILMWDSVSEREEAIGGTPSPLMHQTLARFGAGDYSVRVRGVDLIGNAGAWSVAQIIEHRPTPEPPTALAISGDDLTGTWLDQ